MGLVRDLTLHYCCDLGGKIFTPISRYQEHQRIAKSVRMSCPFDSPDATSISRLPSGKLLVQFSGV